MLTLKYIITAVLSRDCANMKPRFRMICFVFESRGAMVEDVTESVIRNVTRSTKHLKVLERLIDLMKLLVGFSSADVFYMTRCSATRIPYSRQKSPQYALMRPLGELSGALS